MKLTSAPQRRRPTWQVAGWEPLQLPMDGLAWCPAPRCGVLASQPVETCLEHGRHRQLLRPLNAQALRLLKTCGKPC